MTPSFLNVQRPVPTPDYDSRPYWEATGDHRLVMQRCSGCGAVRFYPRALCPECWSFDYAWDEMSGRGIVYSYTIVHRPPTPGFAEAVPYVVGLIDLDEGPRMMSNVAGLPVDEVRIGQRVRVAWEDIAPGIALPIFVPDAEVPVS